MTAITASATSAAGSGTVVVPECSAGDMIVGVTMGGWSMPGCLARPAGPQQHGPGGWTALKDQVGHLAWWSRTAEDGDTGKSLTWSSTKNIWRVELLVVPGATEVLDWCPSEPGYTRFCCSPANRRSYLCKQGCGPTQDDHGLLPSSMGQALGDGLAIGVAVCHGNGYPVVVNSPWVTDLMDAISPSPENPAWTRVHRDVTAGETLQLVGIPADPNYQHGMSGFVIVA